MPERIEDHEMRTAGRPEQYPWDEWLNGSVWRFDPQGEFDVEPESFARSARRAADRRGIRVRVNVEGSSVFVTALQTHEVSQPKQGEGWTCTCGEAGADDESMVLHEAAVLRWVVRRGEELMAEGVEEYQAARRAMIEVPRKVEPIEPKEES